LRRQHRGHAARVEADIAEAETFHGIRADWTAQGPALRTQGVLQGAFILAKANDSADIAATSVDHLRRYVELLFRPAIRRGKETA
jgi:TetR/AcrR family transcriptional repressor of nem operon